MPRHYKTRFDCNLDHRFISINPEPQVTVMALIDRLYCTPDWSNTVSILSCSGCLRHSLLYGGWRSSSVLLKWRGQSSIR